MAALDPETIVHKSIARLYEFGESSHGPEKVNFEAAVHTLALTSRNARAGQGAINFLQDIAGLRNMPNAKIDFEYEADRRIREGQVRADNEFNKQADQYAVAMHNMLPFIRAAESNLFTIDQRRDIASTLLEIADAMSEYGIALPAQPVDIYGSLKRAKKERGDIPLV